MRQVRKKGKKEKETRFCRVLSLVAFRSLLNGETLRHPETRPDRDRGESPGADSFPAAADPGVRAAGRRRATRRVSASGLDRGSKIRKFGNCLI